MHYSKYHARKTSVDGICFDSRKEADYYCELKILKQAGVVASFELQVPFELIPKYKYKGKTVRAMKYIADFVVKYVDGHTEVVDVKGMRTDVYKIKKKMLLYAYPNIDFKEV